VSKRLRILILEDRPEDAELALRALRSGGYDVSAKRVETESEFLAGLRTNAPQLILADYSLPGYDGLSALALAKKETPETPFVFLSGSLGEERAIEALHRGATDYVLKDRLARLVPAVRRALREQEGINTARKAEDQRRETEARYRALFERAPDGIVVLDPETARPLEFNEAAHRQLGYSREEFARLSLSDIEANETPEQTRATIRCVQREEKKDFETRHRTRDGRIRHVHVTAQIVETSGRPVYHCIWRDITERKQAGERIRELNKVMRASREINALTVRESDPQRLLAEACKILVETRGYNLAWIGLIRPGSTRVVPGASAGRGVTYLDGLNVTWDETPAGQGPMGTALRTGKPVVSQDVVTDPRFAPWKENATAHGFASVAALPMIHGTRVLGAVAVYSNGAQAFDVEELELLQELAADLAFALQSIEYQQERQRAEESLRLNERRYRLLFNSSYDGVFVHQPGDAREGTGKFIEVNDVACQRLGYTREELLQLTPRDITAPETLSDVPRIRARLAQKESAMSEGVHITKDGRHIPVEISTHVFELNGKPTRLSTVRDITERKGAEARLHLLSEALESAANAIVITERDGTIIWGNAAFTRLSGYPLEEVLGRKPNLFKSGAHDRAFYQTLWQTVLAGKVWSSEMINRRKDGSLYTEENTITPVRAKQGEITHFIAVKQDITERKRTEQALQERAKLAVLDAEVGSALTRGGTMAEMLRRSSEAIVRHLGALFARVWTFNEQENVLELQASAGKYNHLDGPHSRLPLGKFEIGMIASERRARATNQVVGNPDVSDQEWAKCEGLVAFAGYPLLVEDRLLGVVAMFSRQPFSEMTLTALAPIANNLALGIERKRAEAALQQKEEYFRALTEGASDVTTILDAQGIIRYESLALEQVFGYKPKELVGQSCFDLIHPDDRARVQQEFVKTLGAPGSTTRIEFRYRHKNASWRVLEATTRNLVDDPNVKGLVVNSRDHTERRRLEEELKESSQFNKQIIASAQEGIIVFGRDLKYQVWNPFMAQMTGIPAGQVLGKHPGEVFPFLREAGVLDSIKKALSGESTPPRDLHFDTGPAGKSGWASYGNGPLRNAAGEITGAIGIVRDISESRQAEDVLRESEERFRQLAENIESVFWMSSAKLDRILYVSPAYERIWGRTTASLYEQPKSFIEAIHPEDRARVAEKLEESQAQAEGFVTEYRIVRPDGSVRWVRDRGFPIKNTVGRLERMVGIAEDITERKRAEVRVAAFANLGQRLSAAKTAREAGEIIVNVADELLGWDACVFDLYSPAEDQISHLLTMDLMDGRRTECNPRQLVRRPTPLGRLAIEQGSQLILRDHAETMRPPGLPFGDTSRAAASIMFVPVRQGKEVVGVLSIQSYKPRAYDADSLETLQALADHGAGALERLRAQEALGESEATFRSVWEHSIDGMRLTDGQGRIIAVNDAFCRLVKLPREKLEGQLFTVAYKGRGPSGDLGSYLKRFETGEIVPRFEARAQLWNSDELDLGISTSFVELGGRGKTLLVIFRDISQRKRTELQIRAFSNLGQRLSAARSPAEAARAIYACADLFWKWDCGVLDLVMEQPGFLETAVAYDVLEGHRREVTPSNPVGLVSAMGRRVMAQGAELILRKPEELSASDTIRFGDASRLSASLMCVPVRAESRTVGILSIQSYTPDFYTREDVQMLQSLADHCGGALDRLRMEEAWQRAEERLRHLVTQSPAVIYSLKTDGQTAEPVWVSDNIERLLGYSAGDGAQGLFDHLHPQDRQALADGLAEVFAKKHIARDYRVRHQNGEYRWVRDEQRLVCDAQGLPVEIVGSWTDITERKVLEDQLRQSQKLEAVGRLAGGVAHDFNNMLAVIRGNAELLLMREAHVTASAKEGLTQVVEASERAANLTRQLLAFSRKQVLQPQSLILNDVIVNLTKMLKRIIGENIDLQCHYAAPLPHVHADPGMIEQVILNLVVNARDAMPAGGQLRVATECVRFDEAQARAIAEGYAGEFACLTVSDTGTGIAPDVLPRVFEPFFTTKEVGKGTGLGLATVYGIVQQHHGWIEVASRIGEGSAFKVFLPAIPTPERRAELVAAEAEVPGGTETVLLVEDDHAVRMTTRRVLESKGYKIREAACPREALELWKSCGPEFDLLLTDIIMPEGMTGRTLAERLREQRPDLKVIFMSGYSPDVVDKDSAFLRRTRSYFLQKPSSARTLLQTMRQCLDGQGPLPHEPRPTAEAPHPFPLPSGWGEGGRRPGVGVQGRNARTNDSGDSPHEPSLDIS
jgi:PAS domain S-box-containing protein